jgi:Uma2 family endonuclease
MVFREQPTTTIHDLHVLESLPENTEKRFELLQGMIYPVNGPKPEHAYVADEFFLALNHYGRHSHTGRAFSGSVGYTLNEHALLIPDASFVFAARLHFPLPEHFTFAPDVAVEVVSPSNSGPDMMEKVEAYIEYGTRLVWVAYPRTRSVKVWRRNSSERLEVYTVDADGVLTGEDVLPEFSLPVHTVFPPTE